MKKIVERVVAWVLSLGALLFVALLLGFGSGAITEDPPAVNPYATGGNDERKTAEIVIEGFAFSDPITVSAGTEITIINRDGVSHTVTADDMSFDTGVIGGSETATLTVNSTGTFDYFCAIHPSMTGSITVTG